VNLISVNKSATALLVALLLSPFAVYPDTLEVDVNGLKDEALIENVKAHIGSKWVSSSNMATQRRRARFRTDAEIRTAKALRPYGYYFPEIESALTNPGDQSWRLSLTIKAGQAVKVRQLVLEVRGDGSSLDGIKSN